MITPEISEAINQLRITFVDTGVDAIDTGDGGAHVTINAVELGAPYAQESTWIKFTITFQYPAADIYPLFVRPDLSRQDGRGLGEGLSLANFRGEAAVQVSRRSNRLNPEIDTAATKVLKVLEWLRKR